MFMNTLGASGEKKSHYVREDNPELEVVVWRLRKLVKKTVPGTRETVNSWGVPTFEKRDPFCFYMVGKHHVTFGFHNGTSLKDPQGLLEGTGKNIRHVKLRTTEDLKRNGLLALMREAARSKAKRRCGV
jgi:hypothetical protein